MNSYIYTKKFERFFVACCWNRECIVVDIKQVVVVTTIFGIVVDGNKFFTDDGRFFSIHSETTFFSANNGEVNNFSCD